jgi:signal transduction histidine kinase
VRRFLNRSSASNRLLTLLVVSVVVPGLLLAYYGVQAVLQEEELYKATLRERAESLATFLGRDLAERVDGLLGSLDAAAAEGSQRWASDPGAAAARLSAAEPLVAGVLVLDEGDKLRHPQLVATGLLDRLGGRSMDRLYLAPRIAEAERLELITHDFPGAADAYRRALDGIPGQRGNGIVRIALARSLQKAKNLDASLALFDRLSKDSEAGLDLNDFPIDLLATYQAALVQQDLGHAADAAARLAGLLDTLVDRPWTYGGYGETALARRAIDLLGDAEFVGGLSSGALPDLVAVQRSLDGRAQTQAEEALVLGLLPAIASEARALRRSPGEFQLQSYRTGERALLFAHCWWTRGERPRRILVHINAGALRAEVEASLTTAARANPEFATALVRSGPGTVTALPGSPRLQVHRSLEPFLPGYSLIVTRGDDALLGPGRRQNRIVRLGMIGGLLIITIFGILLIGRAVKREMEIARLKSDFVSNVSHELRTPLTTIRIMAEMLALGAVASEAKQNEYYRNIVSEAERLSRLINNVLDFARIEEGRKKFQFGMGDIGDLVFEVERITGDYVRSEGFTLEAVVASDLPATAFDRDAVIQALINLMSNAVKYSRNDKRVEMGARVERDTITLYVRDRGPGIDPREIPHLFEKFYRGGDHMTREVGGTGLGLSIVHHIASAHGGRVAVHSKLGEGSTFEILLPVQTVEEVNSGAARR